MKKIIIGLIVCCGIFILNVNVHAASLPCMYVEESLGDDSFLKEDRYTLIKTDVKWDVAGTYHATYLDENGDTYQKRINITGRKDALQVEMTPETRIDLPSEYIVRDIMHLDHDNYFVIADRQDENPTYYDQEKISVTFYENNQFAWEYSFARYARYRYSVLAGDELIVCGEIYNEDDNYKTSVCLFRINKERDISCIKEIKAEVKTEACALHFYEDKLYLLTLTAGKSFSYAGIKTKDCPEVVLLTLNPATFDIISGVTVPGSNDVFVSDSASYQEKISFHALFLHKENHFDGSYTDCIYVFDLKTNKLDKYPFLLTGKTYLTYSVTKNDVFYCFLKPGREKGVFVDYLNDDIPNKELKLVMPKGEIPSSILLLKVSGNQVYALLTRKDGTATKYLGYVSFSGNNVPMYQSDVIQNEIPLKAGVNCGIYLIYHRNEALYFRQLSFREFKVRHNVTPSCETSRMNILFDGEYLFPATAEEIDYGTYGRYHAQDRFIDAQANQYFFSKEVMIPLTTNIIADAVYPIGYTLKMNSCGLLNGNEIPGEYMFDTPQSYTLVVGGDEDHPKTTYNFSVKEINLKNKERRKDDFAISEIKAYKRGDYSSADLRAENNIKDSSFYSVDTVGIALSILVAGAMGMFFLRKKI